jgi:hypothetical protein
MALREQKQVSGLFDLDRKIATSARPLRLIAIEDVLPASACT